MLLVVGVCSVVLWYACLSLLVCAFCCWLVIVVVVFIAFVVDCVLV